MTRIVLILTAIPLAAILALLLDTLLDRRPSAVRASVRRPTRPRSRGRLSIALALALGWTAAALPAAQTDCASIGCSLLVDAEKVDRLWSSPAEERAKVVAQSRIPVAFDLDLDRWDADADAVAEDNDQSTPDPKREASTR